MPLNLFDPSFYRTTNSDLASLNDAQLLAHFQTYGLAEGRAFSAFADLAFYRASNPDLATAGLNTNAQLLNHLQTNGVAEGRRFSQYADPSFYLAANPDLLQAFGSNREAALQHLQTSGVLEGRRFSQFFDISVYRGSNPDLVTAGLSNLQLLQHFEQYGVDEGRPFSLSFNLGYYRSVYNDLEAARLSNRQLYNHFETNGVLEGRSSSVFLNVAYYLNNNPDLINAGFNYRSAYDHFILRGQTEGRRGAPSGSYLTGAESSLELDFNLLGGTRTINASLTRTDRPNPTRAGSYSDDYRISGLQVGQRVQLNLDANGNLFDTYLQLINTATGQVTAFDDDSGPGLNSQLTFDAQSGIDYIVRATSFNSNAIGNYTLTATAQSTVAGSITGSQTLSGQLSGSDFTNPARTPTYRDDYLLTSVSAGQQIRVNLATTSGFDTYLQLVNALTGAVIGFNDDYPGLGLNSQLDFTVQAGITYALRVTSYAANATGSYTLATTTLVPTIGVNQTISGALDSTDPLNPLRASSYRDDYRLSGATVGQQIRINLDSPSFDTYLYLINEGTGVAITFDDDSGPGLNSEITFTVQSGINYLIRVSSFSTSVTGNYSLVTTPISATDWFTQNLLDAELQTIARNLSNDGTLDRNDWLAVFRNAEDGGVISANEVTDLRTLVANSVRFRVPEYVQFLAAQVAQGAFSNQTASVFESSVLGRWFLGTVAPTAQFTQSGGATYALTYVSAQGSLFGSSGRAQIGDIDQGAMGDCAFLAALGATFGRQSNDAGNAASAVINSMIIDNGDNTYTFRFYQGGTPQWVTVDRRLATSNGRLFGASANGSRDPSSSLNILWGALAERAYAQWREWREGSPGYNLIGNGDTLERPLQFVTGRAATSYSGSSITYAQLDTALNAGRAVGAGNFGRDTTFIVGGHAYSVTNVYTTGSEQRVVVRNPWGVDGLRASGNGSDGFIDLSFTEFRNTFGGVAIS